MLSGDVSQVYLLSAFFSRFVNVGLFVFLAFLLHFLQITSLVNHGTCHTLFFTHLHTLSYILCLSYCLYFDTGVDPGITETLMHVIS